ncbi:MAG: phytoene desaturase family protein [Acidimicrobiales bacterium]
MYDAAVVGAGPNGLAAAITLAREGWSVVVYEAEARAGGGTRSEELTRPGFIHDVCSAAHPFGAASPLFASLPLAEHGLEWVHPDAPLAHPLPDGTAALIERSVGRTSTGLGRDGRAWRRLVGPIVERWGSTASAVLGPVLRFPPPPPSIVHFGLRALWPATVLANGLFREDPARALVAGLAAHAAVDLRSPLTASFAIALAAAGHAVGWPVARGGSQRIADALVGVFESFGGEVVTGHPIRSLADLPATRTALFDVTPRQLIAIAGERLDPGYKRRLARFRYGPASFKVDYALDGPVPWRASECGRAATVHMGGRLDEVVAAEADVVHGRHPERPFVICVQPSRFDPTRAPPDQHTFWAYSHVPPGSTVDMTGAVEAQIERFAPGFRDRVLARHVMAPAAIEAHNANYVDGDIAGGSLSGLQLLARPTLTLHPYNVPIDGLPAYLCSASTPPGAGVHGMCGWWAARAALAACRK